MTNMSLLRRSASESPSSNPRPVEVIIACHSASRPLGRAVASVLDGNGEHASVTVVAHGIDPAKLRAVLAPAHREIVRFLHHEDGIPSPAGPFNAGLASATAPWVSIMGSDDRLLPGTVDSWLRIARRTRAEAVLTRLSLGSPDRLVPTPPVRPIRLGRLDARRDRLFYRSAPLGMMRTDAIRRLGLSMAKNLPVGEDVEFTTRLVTELRTAVDNSGPSYVIGEDATDRVTFTPLPMTKQLGFLPPLVESEWFRHAPLQVRQAIVVKMVRIHVFGAIHYRMEPSQWPPEERADLAFITQQLLDAAPGTECFFSLAERDLLDAALTPDIPAAILISRSAVRRRHGRPGTVLTSSLSAMLDPSSPLPTMLGGVGVLLRARLQPPSRAASRYLSRSSRTRTTRSSGEMPEAR